MKACAAATSIPIARVGISPLRGSLYIAFGFLLGACGVNTGNLRGQRSLVGAADAGPLAASMSALTAETQKPKLLRFQCGTTAARLRGLKRMSLGSRARLSS